MKSIKRKDHKKKSKDSNKEKTDKHSTSVNDLDVLIEKEKEEKSA